MLDSFFSRSCANVVVGVVLLATVVWAIVSLAPLAFVRWF